MAFYYSYGHPSVPDTRVPALGGHIRATPWTSWTSWRSTRIQPAPIIQDINVVHQPPPVVQDIPVVHHPPPVLHDVKVVHHTPPVVEDIRVVRDPPPRPVSDVWSRFRGRTPCREVLLPGNATRPDVRVKLFCDEPSLACQAQRADIHFGAHGRGIEIVRSTSVPY
ncbi:unnamed protein product [Durusdinium trenchii]|uniref:Uncharacterized protein n=1 Tax=Durusdinium trenchii TaxID=1381693 RepID=A0ABP0J4C1_9DINO